MGETGNVRGGKESEQRPPQSELRGCAVANDPSVLANGGERVALQDAAETGRAIDSRPDTKRRRESSSRAGEKRKRLSSPPITEAEPGSEPQSERPQRSIGGSDRGAAGRTIPREVPHVAGLTVVEEFVDRDEAASIEAAVRALPWSSEIARRTQHYGARYVYATRTLGRAPPLPPFLEDLAERLRARGFFERRPDQCIVNLYRAGQGISPHVDHREHFGPVVATLSLGAETDVVFARDGRRVPVPARARSVLVLVGDARYKWSHSLQLPGLSADRISITFRTLHH